MSPLSKRLSKRRALRLLAGYAALGALVGLAALPVAFAVEPARRPAVIRLAAGALLAVALLHLVGAARRWVDAQPPSAFDRAVEPGRAEPSLDRHFRELLDELRFGRASQSYWSRVLWPRLLALADRLPAGPALTEPPRSRRQRLLGLGPSTAALRDLIARLTERA